MINYRKKISLKRDRQGDWSLETDMGGKYLTNAVMNTSTPITDWWEKNHHGDLREWQKDAILKTFGDAIGSVVPYIVYKRGQGYSQAHDITLARFDKVWILSTERDLWISTNDYAEFTLDVEDSLGSILDRSVRDKLYQIADAIKVPKEVS